MALKFLKTGYNTIHFVRFVRQFSEFKTNWYILDYKKQLHVQMLSKKVIRLHI